MKSLPFLMCAMIAIGASAAQPKQQKVPECCQVQAEPLTCYMPAFNAPAEVAVHSKDWVGCNEITAFVDASFTYWLAGEEGLKIASSGVFNGGTGTSYWAPTTHTLNQSFNYKPGFKVGVGVIFDHEWTFHAEYTWFRGTNRTSSKTLSDPSLTAGTVGSFAGTSAWLVDDWFLQGTSVAQALAGSSVSSKWRLKLDFLDVVAGRPFYQSRRTTISPFAGLRGALIRQTMNVQLTEIADLFPALPAQPIQSHNTCKSWGIGPRVGCSGRYLCHGGFRLEADTAFNLLYTKYTKVKHQETPASLKFNPGPYKALMNSYSCLRPSAEVGLGVGWGSYFNCHNYYIDIAATYDFQILWSQNVMRKLLDDTLTGTSPSAADLYVHGLTFTTRFDF